MSKLIGLAILAGGVALAVVIGQRMSTDAMAVVIGVAVGVVASIPTSLLVMAAMRRGQPSYERPEERRSNYPPPQQPTIYVVTPQQAPTQVQAQLPAPAGRAEYGPAGFYPAERRQYRVVGSDGEPQSVDRWDDTWSEE